MPVINRPSVRPGSSTTTTPTTPLHTTSTTSTTSTSPAAPLPSSGGLAPTPAGAGPSSSVTLRAGQSVTPFQRRPTRSAGFQSVDASAFVPPTPSTATHPARLWAPGTAVSAVIGGAVVTGTYVGFDYKGRAVFTDGNNARRVVDFAALKSQGPVPDHANVKSVLSTLPAGAVVAPPARLLKALDAALDLKVVGTHTAREYSEAFAARGFEVFVVGGGVRDAIATLSQNPNASDQELIDVLNDVDIVTTAPPPVAREICEGVAPELKGGGVWSPKFVEQFGVVLAGGKKAGLAGSDGLDIATMKHSGMTGDQAYNADTGEKAFQTTFGLDMERDARARDFCCNALYYDPHTQLVVDPTLQGIADAEHKLLHPVRTPLGADEATVSPRFWKFRLRGFGSDGEALKAIRQHASQVFSTSSGRDRWRLQNALGRCAPKDADTPAKVEAWLKDLRAVMHQDHCADLFDRALRGGVRQGVISEVLKRTTKGSGAPATGASGASS